MSSSFIVSFRGAWKISRRIREHREGSQDPGVRLVRGESGPRGAVGGECAGEEMVQSPGGQGGPQDQQAQSCEIH